MAEPARIVGSYLSPYVRKVLVCLELKGVAYEIDPIIPFFGDDRFAKASPLRRVPVLIDDRVTLADSSVICQYLEDRYPEPPLYPRDVTERARARWFEEFADTRMGDVFIWRLFNQLAIRPHVWGEKTDDTIVAKTLAEDVPQVLDYLESELPAEGYACGGGDPPRFPARRRSCARRRERAECVAAFVAGAWPAWVGLRGTGRPALALTFGSRRAGRARLRGRRPRAPER